MAVLVPSRPCTSYADYAHAHLTTFNHVTRLPNALSTTALHPRPLPIVLNSSKQSGIVGDTCTKFTDLLGPSKTHPRSFPTSVRLHKTSPDHQGWEKSAARSAKCDWGLTQKTWNVLRYPNLESFQNFFPISYKTLEAEIFLTKYSCQIPTLAAPCLFGFVL